MLIPLDKLYGNNEWTPIWLGDLFCLKGEYQNSLKYYSLSGLGTSTHLSNKIMNIKYRLKLPLGPLETIEIDNVLTGFGKKNINDISKQIEIILNEKGSDILQEVGKKSKSRDLFTFYLFEGYSSGDLRNNKQNKINWYFQDRDYYFNKNLFYTNKVHHFCKTIQREAENNYRESIGVPKIGEGWVSETQLYYLIKEHYKDCEVVQHGNPTWLSPQHLDIYFPKNNIGIEYQGKQHFEPIEIFGGEEGYKKTVERDKRKAKLCKNFGCKLIYVLPDYDIDKVLKQIDKHLIDN